MVGRKLGLFSGLFFLDEFVLEGAHRQSEPKRQRMFVSLFAFRIFHFYIFFPPYDFLILLNLATRTMNRFPSLWEVSCQHL